jgi:hypothetical protein
MEAEEAAKAMANELKEVDLEEEEEIEAHTEAIRQLQAMTVAIQRRAAARRVEIRQQWFDALLIPLSEDEQDYIDMYVNLLHVLILLLLLRLYAVDYNPNHNPNPLLVFRIRWRRAH